MVGRLVTKLTLLMLLMIIFGSDVSGVIFSNWRSKELKITVSGFNLLFFLLRRRR